MLINRDDAIKTIHNVKSEHAAANHPYNVAIRDAINALRALPVSDGWEDIATAPRDGTEFLAYGCYIYPGDDELTEYMAIAWYSYTKDYPWEDADGRHPDEFFCRWRPLPAPPTIEEKA
jgi:hypothetical protein